MRAGTKPPAVYDEPWFTRAASSEDSRSTSTLCPSPLLLRCCRAARIPTVEKQAGEDVDQGDADLLRLAVRVPRDAHQAADGLDEQVVTGQGRAGGPPEAGNRAVDQSRVAGAQLLVA